MLMSFDDVRMELVEEFICESIIALRQREQWYIDNHPCCNKFNAVGWNIESLKEKSKKRYEINKEHINERKKEYYDTNKERISEQKKIYYEMNKEVISEKKRIRHAKKKLEASAAATTEPKVGLKSIANSST